MTRILSYRLRLVWQLRKKLEEEENCSNSSLDSHNINLIIDYVHKVVIQKSLSNELTNKHIWRITSVRPKYQFL